MPKKISITFLLTVIFPIIALFAASQVLAEGKKITPPETLNIYSFTFEDGDGTPYEVRYTTNQTRTHKPAEVHVKKGNEPFRRNDWGGSPILFKFCIEDQTGEWTIKGPDGNEVKCSCHQLLDAKPESFLVGNSPGYCPFFWGGMWINLCP
jgi:hypothetical protein